MLEAVLLISTFYADKGSKRVEMQVGYLLNFPHPSGATQVVSVPPNPFL